MPSPALPQMSPDELAQRLDRGEPLQLLDIRASERVAQGAVSLGPTLDFRAFPASQMYALPRLDPLALDPGRPVAVMCGHGNSSRQATLFLDRKSTRLNSSHSQISYAVFCLTKQIADRPLLRYIT